MSAPLLFGWGMWAVFLLSTLIYWAELSFDIYSNKAIYISDAFRALTCTLVTSWFLLVPDWNKLHLFWLAFVVVAVGDWIEYQRLPPVFRMMRRLVGRQPVKVRPTPEVRWVWARKHAVPPPPRQLDCFDVAGVAATANSRTA
jgi:hypothetical protein